MRYITKGDTPPFFAVDTEGFTKWSDYNKTEETKQQRRNLRKYLLENEQNYLCGYCESKVTLEDSHTDHKKPKGLDRYSHLVFSYSNFIVSCEGKEHYSLQRKDEEAPESTCGHKKDNEFDEALFIDPHEKENISTYFTYDKDTGMIMPNATDEHSERYKKANFMIKLLQLNEGFLPRARLNAKKVLHVRLKRIRTGKEDQNTEIIRVLESKKIAFISFVDHCFSSRIK
ncbi:retron system putative HNH endonuclease [Vibrio splendidus]